METEDSSDTVSAKSSRLPATRADVEAIGRGINSLGKMLDRRLIGVELAISQLVGVAQIQAEKLDAVLKATTGDEGPSETTALLKQIVTVMETVVGTLEDLPERMGEVIRDELSGAPELDMEEGGPDTFEPR